jgi:hypothetical protein
MSSSAPTPWLIQFFRRPRVLDPERAVPTIIFLGSLAVEVAAEIHAVLDAVAEVPPPSFSGGGKWEAMHMHGDMAGIYEVRVQGGGQNHRLFCLLERHADDLGGSSIVCIGGLSKPRRHPAKDRDYRQIKKYVRGVPRTSDGPQLSRRLPLTEHGAKFQVQCISDRRQRCQRRVAGLGTEETPHCLRSESRPARKLCFGQP